ncbi:MAG: fluoride efflux transporter CrcB [Actinomycetota bacterium]|nr:fluoride efflux transporter CrcB [Actinomycetota bacterium]
MIVLGVALAGAVGAPARFLLDTWLSERLARAFPWGTLVVNVSGSLLLGVVAGLGLYHGLPDTPRLLLATGFCGAYTTFSTFAVETVRLARDGARGAAVANTVGSLVAGLLAAAAGLALASAL